MSIQVISTPCVGALQYDFVVGTKPNNFSQAITFCENIDVEDTTLRPVLLNSTVQMEYLRAFAVDDPVLSLLSGTDFQFYIGNFF